MQQYDGDDFYDFSFCNQKNTMERLTSLQSKPERGDYLDQEIDFPNHFLHHEKRSFFPIKYQNVDILIRKARVF